MEVVMRRLGVLSGLLLCAAFAGAPSGALAPGEPPTAGGDLGSIDFPTSGSAAAQPAFLRGVLLLHSFEFKAARSAFQSAQKIDPGFAMAYWGEALTYNAPLWGLQDTEAARKSLEKLGRTPAERAARAPTERERAYLASLDRLYGTGDKAERDRAYSDALGDLARRFPDDLDARAFYALSLMGLTDTTRNTANYMRAAAEAEAVHERNRAHPGALHYLIHAYDDPVHAPLGLRAARAYGQIARGAPHAQHMPSHIYFALGLWDDAIESNVAALKSARDAGGGGYHMLEWLTYARLQRGQADEARRLLATVTDDVAKDPHKGSRGALAVTRAIWLVESRGAPAPGAADSVADEGIAAIGPFVAHDFARGVVAGERGDAAAARASLTSIQRRIEAGRQAMKGTASSWSDTVTATSIEQAQIMAEALQGAIEVTAGAREAGFARLREAVGRAERLTFEFGPPWSAKPLEELHGDLLLASGDRSAAAAAYGKVLAAYPNRRLALEGLARAEGRHAGADAQAPR
jgi:tetratricopeptide (TPR) repeat protein